MGKTKKGNRINSDAINAKKTAKKEKKINPFEVHLNKEKFTILGRKCKHDRGLPGVSRSKAVKKRKQTLGQEFKDHNKVNKFKDGRMAPDAVLDEEAATARFVTEKMMQFKSKKKDIFNLNDEVLTHRGQTLEEIEQFQDPASEESEDEGLDAEFTEAAHFGGQSDPADRKAAIEEMIAESKRKKIESAKEKDEVYKLTAELDQNYKGLIPLIGKFKTETGQKGPRDDYDRLLKEMVFEPRGEVSDKLKTEEELMKENKARLERLENERLARMRGEDPADENQKPKHKSADDLDDGYFAGSVEEEDEATLAYSLNDDDPNNKPGDSENEEESDASSVENFNAKEEDDNMSEMSEDNEESDDDGLSDLKDSESEAEDEQTEFKKNNSKPEKEAKSEKTDELKLKASKELPYTFEIPTTYEMFSELMDKYPDHKEIVVERIIKCNNPKLDPSNKDKMVKLFVFLLQYVNDCFSESNEENIEKLFKMFDRLVPHIYDISHMNPDKTANCLQEIIKEKYEDFKKNPKHFPSVDFVIFFKLVSLLYSTSDFRHSIVTPIMIFVSHILSKAEVKTRCDVAIGLFLVNIVLECTQLSRRFLPGALNFLRGVIFLCISKRPIEVINVVPPFQSTGLNNNLLVLESDAEVPQVEDKMLSKDLVVSSCDDSFKVRALSAALKVLIEYADVLRDNIGANYLLHPFVELLDKLNIEKYPELVKQSYNRSKASINQILNRPMQLLVAAAKRPKALKLMEPRIEKVYDDKRRPKLSKEKEERAIMFHKVKRETKGAIREIRRDNAFLSKLQIKKQIQSDLERKEKVHRIYAEAAVQQGELNAMSRKRKKM